MKVLRVVVVALFLSGVALAEEHPEAKPTPPEDEAWKPPIQKKFSEKDRQAECKKYEGKFIGYYSSIYLVEDCKRREINDPDMTAQVTLLGVKNVSADTLIKIDEGKPLEELKKQKVRSCAELNGQYVTHGGGDVFYVEKCKKRPFADWETYLSHREDKKRTRDAVLELNKGEYDKLETGTEIASILDKVFKDLLEGSAEVHVIPVDEACKGVNGKYVTYYSRMYKVEQCKKREINAENFLKKNHSVKFIELSGEQWLSLPDGRPI